MYSLSERKDITSIAVGKYLTFNLNPTGLGWISATGTTKLGLREGHDVIDSAFISSSTTTSQFNWTVFSSSEFSGTTQDPYLTVTYTQSTAIATTTTVTNAVAYQYDQSGQRTKKIENSKVSIYPNKLYNIENGKIKKHIFAGDNSVATIDDGKIVYHHTDHLSGSSVETDKDGFAVEVLDYYPYGSIRTDSKYTAYENKKKFTGYELDDSGLYYAGRRYYMSEVGRFVSIDPLSIVIGTREAEQIVAMKLAQLLADPQALNSYSYVKNNPLRYIDPDGDSPLLAAALLAPTVANLIMAYGPMLPAIIQHPQAAMRSAPFVGDAIDATEFASGQNLFTGESLSGFDRALTGVAAGLPFLSGGMVRQSLQQFRAGDVLNGLRITNHAADQFIDRAMNIQQIKNALNQGISYLDKKTGNLLWTLQDKKFGNITVVTDNAKKAIVSVENFIRNLSSPSAQARFEKVKGTKK